MTIGLLNKGLIMAKKVIYATIIGGLLFSCKSRQAREPVSETKGYLSEKGRIIFEAVPYMPENLNLAEDEEPELEFCLYFLKVDKAKSGGEDTF